MSEHLKDSPEVVVEAMLPQLFNTACYLSGTRKDAEDAVQEAVMTYLETHRKAPSRVRNPLGWSLTVLARICRKRRLPRPEVPLLEETVSHQALSPVDQVLSEERRDLVMRAMATLPDTEQEAISLHIFGGLTVREAAAALEVPSSTLDKRIQAGLERLRGRLAPLSMAVSIAWLKALPPAPVPAGLEASLTAAAGGIAATGSGVGLVASSSLATGGIAMSLFSGKAGLGVSAVLAAALIVAGIQVHLMKEENGVLKEKLAQARKQTAAGNPPMGNAAQHQPDPAAPPSPKAAVAIPVAKDPGPAIPDVDALVAKVRAAFEVKDAEAFSDAALALLDAGEPAYPALIALMQEMGDPTRLAWLAEDPAGKKLYLGLMMRAPSLGGLVDAILIREGDPDKATRMALELLETGVQSRLSEDRQAVVLLGILRKTVASPSDGSRDVLDRAGDLLGRLKPTETLPEFERLLAEAQDQQTRRSLLNGIAQTGGPEAVASLRRILDRTEDANARMQLIGVLSGNKDPAANALLWELAGREPDGSLHYQLLSALSSRRENRDSILQQLKAPQTPERDRRALLDGLTWGLDGDRKATWALYDSEPALRDDLLPTMVQTNDPKATELLLQRLQSGQITERLSYSFQFLEPKVVKENTEALRGLAAGATTPLGVRTGLFFSLYRVDRQGALDAFMTGFPQRTEGDRLQTTQSLLGSARDQEGRAVLEQIAASDPSELVRQMAAKGLAR